MVIIQSVPDLEKITEIDEEHEIANWNEFSAKRTSHVGKRIFVT